MADNTIFTGFGFGAIQAGLFAYEAFNTGRFERIVIAEVLPDVVRAVRRNGGAFSVNIAGVDGIRNETVHGVELLNPREPADRARLVDAVAASAEIATALPSVAFFGDGSRADHVTGILRDGLMLKHKQNGPPAIIYTAENNNHAAEALADKLKTEPDSAGIDDGAVCLNTVIGKMSGVVVDEAQIVRQHLLPVATGMPQAFLVEEFNRILISRIPSSGGFMRRIDVFEEKDDLLPFEEAKLYGHNATHAFIGYMLARRGAEFMDAAGQEPKLLAMARDAFINESGRALCRKYAGYDELFTSGGFAAYAEDLLSRMMNPHLCDRVDRVVRDPRRKLDWDDRLIGTMRLALSQNVPPLLFARAAAAAAEYLARLENCEIRTLLQQLWPDAPDEERRSVLKLINSVIE